ncbi:DUF4327 family protein [Anthocerotibacter panamensis]|uniref:DUF4327 family protein n=1 Tax=Anthocerotibacter panamensis TaxID=2857077 RepID=UPI001C403C56|nr:DUF4327 family protein [Anthocerotibacter panamensis]
MLQAVRFALPEITNEVRWLVNKGRLRRNQPVAALAYFYTPVEWQGVLEELCLHDYTLQSPICELLAVEDWPND